MKYAIGTALFFGAVDYAFSSETDTTKRLTSAAIWAAGGFGAALVFKHRGIL